MENIEKRLLNQSVKQNCDNLIKQHWQTLWNFCYRLTFNTQEAENLLEEVLYRIVRYFDNYKQDRPFMGWVCTIALNALKTYKKNRIKDFVYIEKSIEESIPERKDTTFNTITRQYLEQKLSKCLETLNPFERMVFCMKYFDDKKYNEIAESIQINENSARVYFLRAKEKIKKSLGGWIYEL